MRYVCGNQGSGLPDGIIDRCHFDDIAANYIQALETFKNRQELP